MHEADVSRAVAAGLTFCPFDETVLGAFERAKPTADAGLTPEREAGLLQAWRLRRQQGRFRGRGGSAPSTSWGKTGPDVGDQPTRHASALSMRATRLAESPLCGARAAGELAITQATRPSKHVTATRVLPI